MLPVHRGGLSAELDPAPQSLQKREDVMERHDRIYTVLLFAVVVSMFMASSATGGVDKIPITAKTDKAREYYLKGLDLSDKLRGQESIEYYQNAVAEDSAFALAYLNLAFVTPSAKGFFENLAKAKALIDHVSDGERLWILGVEAGVNGFPMKQREFFKQLVAAYPDDERAHTLLGNHYFVQQEYALAIEQYEEAAEIAPDFSPLYNQLGYSHRFLESYDEAEEAFKKYIAMIPDDPNPYDSYAELLMKVGRYEESIESYRKALEVDPNFVPSHIGIATNLNFMGKHEAARKQLDSLYAIARNDGERRAVHFAKAVSHIDEGDMARAVEELEKQYALAAKIEDASAMSGDLITMGNVLFEWGKYDEASAKYRKAVEMVKESDLSPEIKDNTELNHLYNAACIAMKRGDFAGARAGAERYLEGVEAIRNPNQIRLAHQLAGMIALEEKDYDKALEELAQASQQNPYNLYRMSLAYRGKGDDEKAREFCRKAAEFNGLNNLNYAFIRTRAIDLLE
jgi:tetratricopeptide (TPR) repeat protein